MHASNSFDIVVEPNLPCLPSPNTYISFRLPITTECASPAAILVARFGKFGTNSNVSEEKTCEPRPSCPRSPSPKHQN